MYISQLNAHVVDVDDPANAFGYRMMEWFEGELKAAADKNQKIYVLGHIPPQPAGWLDDHLLHYQILMDTYKDNVKGQFFGHDHQVSATRRGVMINEQRFALRAEPQGPFS